MVKIVLLREHILDAMEVENMEFAAFELHNLNLLIKWLKTDRALGRLPKQNIAKREVLHSSQYLRPVSQSPHRALTGKIANIMSSLALKNGKSDDE